MGSVYEAVHVEIGKRVALKLIHPAFAAQAEVIARFRREARAAARIESDYIVQCFDVGEDPEHGLFLVIEFLEGEDLEQRLQQQRCLDTATVVTIGYQVARGLAKAHAAGVIHRDLKPANVFLTTRRDDDTLLTKLLDFGISKLREADAVSGVSDGITDPSVTLGTPQYMSPEQVQGIRPLDVRTDVWSLAAVLYECARGSAPFGDRDYLEIMLAIARDDIPPLREVAPWVPRSLADIIHAGLARDREQRIPDAATFAKRLVDAYPNTQLTSGSFSVAKVHVSGVVPAYTEERPPSSSEADAARIFDRRALAAALTPPTPVSPFRRR
jgi:serine/threonine-protein kinase